MLERELEKRLVEGVKKLGGKAYKLVSPGNTGVPDRMIIMPGGHVIFVELKTDTGRLTKLQQRQISVIKRLGCNVLVAYGLTGVIEVLEVLENGF